MTDKLDQQIGPNTTPFELARLRLKSFELLNGWGQPDEKGDFRKWDYEQRKEKAAQLAQWAMNWHHVCNFCGKSQTEVKKLVAGMSTMICDECIVACQSVVSGEAEAPPKEGDEKSATAEHCPTET